MRVRPFAGAQKHELSCIPATTNTTTITIATIPSRATPGRFGGALSVAEGASSSESCSKASVKEESELRALHAS